MSNAILVIIALKLGISCIKRFAIRPAKLKMNLKKFSKSDSVKVIELPEELYHNYNDEDLRENEVYHNYYEMFGKKIESIVPRQDLDNYYRNFASVKEKKVLLKDKFSYFLKTGGLVGGGYYARENKIDLKSSFLSDLMNSIPHELLHVSSTYYDKESETVYSGFYQCFFKKDKKKSESYGLGINEGYTQYLTNKYFNNSTSLSLSTYKEEQIIAKGLERIIGEQKIQSMYFRADLHSLVSELEKYATKDEIYKFINLTDLLCISTRDKKLKLDELDKAKEFINLFLMKAYIGSIKEKNDIDDNKLLSFISECLPYKDVKNIAEVLRIKNDYNDITFGK